MNDHNRSLFKGVLSGVGFLVLLLFLNFWILKSYQNHVIEMTQDNLMVAARSASNSLSLFYKEKLEEFCLYAPIAAEKESYLGYYLGLNKEYISSVSLFNSDQTLLSVHGTSYEKEAKQAVLEAMENPELVKGKAILLKPVLSGSNHFIQFMVCRVSNPSLPDRFVVTSIETGEVYKKIVQPIKVGENGYSMVKDTDGVILMHPTLDQIGLNAVKGRLAKYKDYNLDLSSLGELLNRQKNNKEGKEILNSYWWDELTAAKKVLVYTRADIGEQQWIVNVTLNYKELEKPLGEATRLSILAAVVILALFGVFLSYFINRENKTSSMEVEVKYLKELNGTLEQLHQKEEQVKHGSRLWSVGILSGMINHEFNNFLTPILVYGELILADKSVDGSTRESVAEIVLAAKKAAELTKELSSYTRKDSGGKKIVVLNVRDQLERNLKMVRKLLPNSIHLHKEITAEECYIQGSQSLISQIVINLSTNALYAMKDSKGRLTVIGGTVKSTNQQRRYRLIIGDTGPGMTEEVRSQIFEPFFTTKREGEGTGLGLSVIHGLITRAGGSIEVKSELGKGTTFIIEFPLCQIVEEQDLSLETKKTVRYKELLLLEDQDSVRKALGKGLEKRKHRVVSCKTPVEALRILKKNGERFDAILTADSLPGMGGIEFAGIVRCIGVGAKIILICDLEDQDILEKKTNNVDGILEKPVTVEGIEEVLRKL
ncbi:ATP-binding protein [Clostridium sp. E02]|uniref:ATP-binding protein n=1 Tax=Clostridium sp. E02 TaxID=2487134 RepID=UPI0013DE2508|nr:ATP-binding protein [Clostridium sp. E02]